MIPSLPCESTQKMLSNDTHIIYYHKRQCPNISHSHIIICTNTFTSFQKWQRVFVWENGLGGNLGSHDFIAGGWQVCKTL